MFYNLWLFFIFSDQIGNENGDAEHWNGQFHQDLIELYLIFDQIDQDDLRNWFHQHSHYHVDDGYPDGIKSVDKLDKIAKGDKIKSIDQIRYVCGEFISAGDGTTTYDLNTD